MIMRSNARRSTGTIATVGAYWRASSRRQDGRRRDMRSEAQTWSNDKEAMRPLNYEVMFDVEDHHWWFVGRRTIVFSQIEDALGTNLGAHAASPARPSPGANPSRTDRPGMRALSERRILDIGC